MNVHEFDSVVSAAGEGAEWAWSRLYEELAPQILGYLRVRGARNPEDLVGEVFVQLARNLARFSGDAASFRSWVFMIAHHRLSNERRRFARRPEVVGSAPEASHPVVESAEDAALRAMGTEGVLGMLVGLTPEQRDVIALRVIADLSLDETARIMGKKVGAIKQLQRRALLSLRGVLEREAVTR